MGSTLNLQVACLLFLFAWATEAAAAPMKTFNVQQFGAIADGKTDSSKAFLDAWNETCAWTGPGTLLIPKGIFLVGPVLFQGPCNGPITVQVSGVVKAPGLEKFPADGWIEFQQINGFLLTGDGTFDGQGAVAWPHNKCTNSQKCKLLPTSLRFSHLTHATIHGISSVNSKMFHMNVFECDDIKFHSIKIAAPDESPNTDGIHISNSRGVRIFQSAIGTGDDCISIGAGNSDVSISDVFCGPGHGISVGSLGKYADDLDVTGIVVRNCTLAGTANGVRIKTWQDSSIMSATNFTFENIVVDNVRNPIIIDQEYCPYSSCSQKASSRVKISNVSFRNIRGTSATPVAVNLLCSKSTPCRNLKLDNINLLYKGPDGPSKSSCSNTQGTSTGPQSPPSCL